MKHLSLNYTKKVTFDLSECSAQAAQRKSRPHQHTTVLSHPSQSRDYSFNGSTDSHMFTQYKYLTLYTNDSLIIY